MSVSYTHLDVYKRQILNRLFNRELDPMYPYLTYQDFLNACGLAEEDLNLD